MNPLETRMNPDSSSGIHVAGGARARAQPVTENREKDAREKGSKRAETKKRNSTARDNHSKAFQRVRQTVMENETLPIKEALAKHKPATDFSFALQRLGTKPTSLVDGEKNAVIDALVLHHQDSFSSSGDIPTFERVGNFDDALEDTEDISDVELEEV